MALRKIWKNRPFGPLPGETPAEYEARLDAWAAANPGDYTPLDKAGMEDVETRVQRELDAKAAVTALAAVESRTLTGTGSPEGVVAASPGALYSQTDGAGGKVLWVKNAGTANTGWRLKHALTQVEMILYGPECRESAALQAETGTTYAFPGSALSASTVALLSGADMRVLRAYWSVVWTPNATGCGIRLISADAGPTNITQIAEITGSAVATPLNEGTYLPQATIQALFDFTAAGEIAGVNGKTLGHQTKGNGTVSPLIYVSRLQFLVET